MKITHPLVRGLVLLTSVSALSFAVLKAQGCKTSDPQHPATSDEPVVEPTTDPPLAAQADPMADEPSAPDAGAAADVGRVDAGDAGPPPAVRVLPATKSGGFWEYDDPRRLKPQPQQQKQEIQKQQQNAAPE